MNKELEEKYVKIIDDINTKHGLKSFTSPVDNESYHSELDQVLTDLIRELGYNKIADMYDEASEYFWYA